MSDNDKSMGKILGSIVTIITIIWISIQINKETNFINSIKIFIVNSWVWFIRAKIPLSWIPMGLIVYFLGTFFLRMRALAKVNEVEYEYTSKTHSKLINALEDDRYRKVIFYCIEPRTADQIFQEIKQDFLHLVSITSILDELNRYNGLVYIEEYIMWQSTKEAFDIIDKYHGN